MQNCGFESIIYMIIRFLKLHRCVIKIIYFSLLNRVNVFSNDAQ